MEKRLETREFALALLACAGFAVAAHGPSGAWPATTLAGLGTYVVARVLGLAVLGASLASVGFAASAAVHASAVRGVLVASPGSPEAVGAWDRGDFLALAGFVFLILVCSWWRDARERSTGGEGRISRADLASRAALVVVCVLGIALFLHGRSDSLAPWLVLCPDFVGTPASGAFADRASCLERIPVWFPVPVLAGACVSLFSARGKIARRTIVQAIAMLATFVAVEAPGLVDMWRALPFTRDLVPASAAGIGTFGLALVAGELFDLEDVATRRVAAALLVAGAAACVLLPIDDPRAMHVGPAHGAPDPGDEVVGWIERPSRTDASGAVEIVGWVHPRLPVGEAVARIDRVDERGTAFERERIEAAARWDPLDLGHAVELPDGARVFRFAAVDLDRLRAGIWRIETDFYRRDRALDERPIGTRTVCVLEIERKLRLSISTACIVLAMSIVLCVPRWNRWTALGIVLLAAGQGLHFARTLLPAA